MLPAMYIRKCGMIERGNHLRSNPVYRSVLFLADRAAQCGYFDGAVVCRFDDGGVYDRDRFFIPGNRSQKFS